MPLAEATLHHAQERLGQALPALLVDVWTQIGNGGFGPGYGLLGLGPDGHRNDLGQTADEVYEVFRIRPKKPPHFRWPKRIFPICHFGCGILHCVDLATDEMVIWEPNFWDGRHSFLTALFPTGRNLVLWFETWAEGDTPSNWLSIDPVTELPRLASMEPENPVPRSRKNKTDPKQPDLFSQD